MKRKQIETDNFSFNSRAIIKIAGAQTEVKILGKQPLAPIVKISKDHYKRVVEWRNKDGVNIPVFEQAKADELCDNTDGAKLYTFNHTSTRAQNIRSAMRSLRAVEDTINANITGSEDLDRCLFLTLTYRYNVTDPQKLYTDFKIFNKAMRRFHDKHNIPRYEYICVAEPQGRGCWHTHTVLIYPCVVPTEVTRQLINKCWGRGKVDFQHMYGDNIGKYFAAYLSNVEITQAIEQGILSDIRPEQIKHVEINGEKKAVVKGLRLPFYPTGFRIMRTSRGVKKPLVLKKRADTGAYFTARDVGNFVHQDTKVYDKAFLLSDDEGNDANAIRYMRFNNNIDTDYRDVDIDIINKIEYQKLLDEIDESSDYRYLM
ncbi:rolling circle replication-associated protein [Oscillospiraceae bacterium LTW-04]|nr:hypothetical protein RBH76_06985 [Oscillospiraceae bacterium MB24-C1]